MHRQFPVSPDEARRAKWPHEIFLINLVFNHILVFAATLGVYSTFPLLVLVVPVTSFAITSYIIVKARQIAAGDETWFVKSHWAIAATRNRHFMLLLAVACLVIGGGYWLSAAMDWSRIATVALLGGAGFLPFMVALLVLIVLGNESVHLARSGKLPTSFVLRQERHAATGEEKSG